jgi:hypothetical protein
MRILLPAFTPDGVVLGGGISRSAHLFLPEALRSLEGLDFQVQVAERLDHAALVGAGVAWFTGSNGSPPHSDAADRHAHAV